MSNALALSGRLNVPNFVKDVFLIFLQEFYSMDPDFTWNPDESLAKIDIHDRKIINQENVTFKPGISLIRTPIRFGEVGINQYKGWDLANGRNFYKDQLTGNIVLECYSKVGLEAEFLATTTALAVQTFKQTLMKRGIHKVQNVTIGDEQVVDQTSDYEFVKVPVIIPYWINLSWVVCEPAIKLQGLDGAFVLFKEAFTPEEVQEYNETGVVPPECESAPVIIKKVVDFAIENIDQEVSGQEACVEYLQVPFDP